MNNDTQLAIIEIAEQVLLERMQSKGPTLEDARQLEIYAKLKQLLEDKPTEVVKSIVANEITPDKLTEFLDSLTTNNSSAEVIPLVLVPKESPEGE